MTEESKNQSHNWEKMAVYVAAITGAIGIILAGYQSWVMNKSMKIDQAITRPFLAITHVYQQDLQSGITMQVKNIGDIPGRIIYQSGMSWVDNVSTQNALDTYNRHIIYPDEVVTLLLVTVNNPNNVITGNVELKIGLAVIDIIGNKGID